MSKRKVFRPLNTWGIYLLGITVGFVMIYSLLELSRVCSNV
jgi:hypothetical protein